MNNATLDVEDILECTQICDRGWYDVLPPGTYRVNVDVDVDV